MRRWIAWGTVFTVSLLVWLVALMPAAVVVDSLPALRPGGAPLALSDARGRWWDGRVDARWREHTGGLSWTLDWRGLTPGVRLAMVSDDINAAGWLGARWGGWRLEQWRASLPVAPFSAEVPQGNADGSVELVLINLELAEGTVVDAKGTLNYSGGTVTWGRDGSARVPPLNGRLMMVNGAPELEVTGPNQQQLVHGRLDNQKLNVRVLRAWPQLLGVSQGGDPSDVVFSMSRPLTLGRAG